MNNERIELTKCPRCGATCKVGHDDDWQVFCASCRCSFRPEKTEKVERSEYEEMKKNAKEVYRIHGWVAFK